MDHNNCGKFLNRWELPDEVTCLLSNLYAGQEAIVRTGHGTMDWFKIGKGVCQSCILSPAFLSLYAYMQSCSESHSVVSDSVQPNRQQPTRLPRPWDSLGKNTGVGCHFLLQCMKVKSESEVAQSCPTLSDPTDCSLPGSSIHGIFQARVLEWVAIAFSD